MTTGIHAENQGKQYLIRHERQGQRFAYDSLGESLVNGGKAFCRRLNRRIKWPSSQSPRGAAPTILLNLMAVMLPRGKPS